MVFFLSTENVFDYLVESGSACKEEQSLCLIKPKISKNFNLRISFPSRHFLVKQESRSQDGTTKGDLYIEWLLYNFINKTPELSAISGLISEAIKFDEDNSILIFNYLNDYCDLGDFLTEGNIFPTAVASSVGYAIATIHRCTLDRLDYKNFFTEDIDKIPDFVDDLEIITPETFGVVTNDAIKFYQLYGRYESLGKAIKELSSNFEPCCLTHNDLKLNNILLHLKWQKLLTKEANSSIIRIIDWEKWAWGDPAFDLGSILASYLRIWLNSLVITTDIDIETALRLAIVPLEKIQPSLVALLKAYLDYFPEILKRYPNFITRVMQFTGLALIESIQARISYQEPFDNICICMLQVAKSLLCKPQESISAIFGTVEYITA